MPGVAHPLRLVSPSNTVTVSSSSSTSRQQTRLGSHVGNAWRSDPRERPSGRALPWMGWRAGESGEAVRRGAQDWPSG